MSRKSVGARRRRLGALAATAVLCSTALVATSAVSGAEVRTQKSKIDKNAVIRMGIGVGDNGGSSFDPANSRPNPYNAEWMDLVYDVLIHDTPDGKGAPGLATKWSTPDPSTAEITLRSGVKFTDGTPLTSQAAKTAWEKLLAANLFTTPNDIRAISSIETPDAQTIRVHFSQPVAQTFLNNSTHHSWWLGIPSPTAAAAGNLNTKPVGAGPYQLKDYVQDQKITLEKNPSYWDPKSQLAAGWEFIQASAGPPAVSALQAGTVDLIWSIPPDSIQALEGAGFVVDSTPSERAYQLATCTTNGVFTSKQARQALQYAIDREAIDEGALAGTGVPTFSPMPPQSPYFDKAIVKGLKHDPKKAKALLKEAGVAPGTAVKAVVAAQAPFSTIAEILQQQLKEVGLDMQITQSTNFVADINAIKPDMAIITIEPSRFASFFSGTPGPTNWCGNKNDAIAAAYTATLDSSKSPEEVDAAYQTLQKLVVDESANIPLNMLGLLAAHTKKVKGVEIINSPYGPQLNTVYMVK